MYCTSTSKEWTGSSEIKLTLDHKIVYRVKDSQSGVTQIYRLNRNWKQQEFYCEDSAVYAQGDKKTKN